MDESSAAPMLDGTERAGIAADHRGMCKFQGKDAPGFRTVVAALRRWGADAEVVVGGRRRAAERELGAKGWLEAREMMRGVAGAGAGAGWEGLSGIVEGGGGGGGSEVRALDDADEVGAAAAAVVGR